MEAKGLEVNVGKTKVMTGCEDLGTIEEFGSHPFGVGVCGSGVGDNADFFTLYFCSIWFI